LRWILGCRWAGGGRLEGEEALEDALGLPFSRVGEIYPHVRMTGPTKHTVEALNVICGRKQKSGRASQKLKGMHKGRK